MRTGSIAARTPCFEELYSELAWIHAYDAHAEEQLRADGDRGVLAADDAPFVLQRIEVASSLRGEVLRCVVPSRRAGAHTAVTGATTDVGRGLAAPRDAPRGAPGDSAGCEHRSSQSS
jgi:hypothetical protein